MPAPGSAGRLAAPARAGRLRVAVPALTVLAASAAMLLPLPLAWSVMPHLALVLVLLWAVVQPRLMPPPLAFALGLAHDALAGAPLALNGILFLLLVVAVQAIGRQAPARGLLLAWAPATGMLLAAFLLSWQMERLLLRPAPAGPVAVQALLTCLMFPAMVRLVAGLQRWLSGAEG